GGELQGRGPGDDGVYVEKVQVARLVVENRLGNRHGHARRLHLEDDLAPFFGEGSRDVDLRHARIPVRPATGIAQERHGLLRRGLDLDIALQDRHRGSTCPRLPRAVPSRREVYVPAPLLLGASKDSGVWTPCQAWARSTILINFPALRIPRWSRLSPADRRLSPDPRL